MKRAIVLTTVLVLTCALGILSGCDIYSKERITVNVIDRSTGLPAAGVDVTTIYSSGAINRPRDYLATTDAQGEAQLIAAKSRGIETWLKIDGDNGDLFELNSPMITEGGVPPRRVGREEDRHYSVSIRPGWQNQNSQSGAKAEGVEAPTRAKLQTDAMAPATVDLRQATNSAAPAPARIVHLGEDITVHIAPAGDSFVEVKARTCLDEGFLEQIACSPNTREHESLVVVAAKPSQIHAALLMAGFTPGRPGHWTYENNTLATVNPTGDTLDVLVRYVDRTGKSVEHPIGQWIRNAAADGEEPNARGGAGEFPNRPWVFGGSAFAPNPKFMGPGEHYVADMTGSIIGLVTFGDEVIGFSQVLSDQEDVQPQEWEINTAAMPPMDTEVTLVLRKWRE